MDNKSFGDFLTFRKLATPLLVQIFFWAALVVIVLVGLRIIEGGSLMSDVPYAGAASNYIMLFGFAFMFFSALYLRIWCEKVLSIHHTHRLLEKMDNLGGSVKRAPASQAPPPQAAPAAVFCPGCGNSCAPTQKFCIGCGTALK